LIRRLVAPERLSRTLGLWGAYMPFGTGAALLFGPAFIAWIGWPGWWWLLGLLSLAMAVVLWLSVPAEGDRRNSGAKGGPGVRSRIVRTLRSRGPWLASLAFAVYSAQWLAVIGFLPTIYAQAGFPVASAAIATALAAAINLVGNIASGRLLQRGWRATSLLQCGYAAMIVGAIVAFAGWGDGGAAVAITRYAGVLLFSAVGGLVPGTLFSLAVRVAPDESTVSTTVGWMQQCSALGQFAGPPLAGWVAARAGGWQATCWVTGAFALAGMGVAAAMARFLAGPHRRAPAAAPGSS
jgi:predicted MFS family arabinose efflux permease